MFTGIVEELGELVRIDWHGGGAVLAVRGPLVASDARHGDSIAVSGVCLTVVRVEGTTFEVDVMKETFDRSALGTLAPGDPVNLERAATLETRLGGHVVQGHVDGVGTILAAPGRGADLARTPGDRWDDVRIGLPPGLSRYVVEKGSITVDGVSLTVVSVTDDAFTVSLIPTTLLLTTLGRKAVGDLVNLEVDVIAKYVEKLLTGVRG
jgi:riboflavin synthase